MNSHSALELKSFIHNLLTVVQAAPRVIENVSTRSRLLQKHRDRRTHRQRHNKLAPYHQRGMEMKTKIFRRDSRPYKIQRNLNTTRSRGSDHFFHHKALPLRPPSLRSMHCQRHHPQMTRVYRLQLLLSLQAVSLLPPFNPPAPHSLSTNDRTGSVYLQISEHISNGISQTLHTTITG